MYQSINNIELRIRHSNKTQIAKLEKIIHTYPNLFMKPNQKLIYISRVQGGIRTTTNLPVNSKSYPHPMALKCDIKNK